MAVWISRVNADGFAIEVRLPTPPPPPPFTGVARIPCGMSGFERE
jgi:hypothetical protein